MSRLTKNLALAVPLAAAGALWAAWIFVFVFRLVRMPPELSNEAEILYEASRMARGLPLYTNPIAGVLDDGPLPIRRYVLYGPLAPWLLSLVPEVARMIAARAASMAAWFVGVPLLALTAPKEHRASAFVVALSYTGLFLLARDVAFFTLTPVPVLLAAVALVRVVRKGELDLAASALFVVAWAMKPLVMGIFAGVVVFALVDRSVPFARRVLTVARPAILLAGAIGLLMVGTGGAWLVHLRASTANGMLPLRWLHFTYEYFPILGLPHLIVAVALLRRRKDRRAAWTGSALLASTLWAIYAMGKRGANAGYFMEPCAALVVALAYGRRAADGALCAADGASARAKRLVPIVAVFVAPFVAFASSRGALADYAGKDAAGAWRTLAEVSRKCAEAAPGTQIRAGLPSNELPLSGRVTLAPWQQAILVDQGAFPKDLLVKDLDLPALGCLVHTRTLEGPAPPLYNARGELTYFDGLFDVTLREPIRARFEEFAVVDGLHLFRRRAAPATDAAAPTRRNSAPPLP